MNYQQTVTALQTYVSEQHTAPMSWRKAQLLQLKQLIIEHEKAIAQALFDDLAKPFQEAWMAEISYLTSDINHTLSRLSQWSKKRKVSSGLLAQPASSWIEPEPLGCVLIIGAWNYPLQLLLAPLIAVIAAGNSAVLKPSELAPNVSKLIAKLLPQYLDNKAFTVIEGGVTETTELLTCRFDHIMYTGNSQVAKIVMTAAAKHLTPVTLELGGKSPSFIDTSCEIHITAKRLAWAKWLNSGQTCIAPDYLLTTQENLNALVDALKKQIYGMFTENPKLSSSYGRMINKRHCERVISYLHEQNIVLGGQHDVDTLYIAPTVIVNPSDNSPLLSEEIFGPILPIIVVQDFDAAIHYIKAREKPLAAYLFTRNKQQEQQWLSHISAGSIAINDAMMFTAVADLPFGGVGNSGMGEYCGKAGFDNFSHLKAVIKRPFIKDLAIRFAPFSELKMKILRWLR